MPTIYKSKKLHIDRADQHCSGRIVANVNVVTFVKDIKHINSQINFGVQIGFNQTIQCSWLESCCIFKHNSFQQVPAKGTKACNGQG